MTIRRATPDIRTDDMAASRDFYRRLGFTEAMDLGWVVTMASPTNPTAQVLLFGPEAGKPQPDMSIEVEDVDAVHAAMTAAGADIVYPLRDEEWGVRRFFVRDPSGTIVNVVSHRADLLDDMRRRLDQESIDEEGRASSALQALRDEERY